LLVNARIRRVKRAQQGIDEQNAFFNRQKIDLTDYFGGT
jgi:hypothetical protein